MIVSEALDSWMCLTGLRVDAESLCYLRDSLGPERAFGIYDELQ
jgi:hypothetical protein